MTKFVSPMVLFTVIKGGGMFFTRACGFQSGGKYWGRGQKCGPATKEVCSTKENGTNKLDL